MYHEVSKLRDFYYRSALGRSVQKRLQLACREIWPSIENEILVGYGFASPLLRPFLNEASHIASLMPAEQGVMAWPPAERNVSVMCGEAAWPLGASSVDRLIALHAMENAVNLSALLNEFWRVLSPEGSAIVILPNRLGAWSTNEHTPFGTGRTVSISQMERTLNAHQFEILERHGALFGAPWRTSLGLRLSNAREWMGEKFSGQILAGVWLIEFQKASSNRPIKIPNREPIFATPELRTAGAIN